MTAIRLIALDLDGTLLASDGTLSARVERAIREARARDVVVTLATARRWTGATPYARQLDLTAPLILYDGALVRTFPHGETQLQRTLKPDLAQRAAETIAQWELQVVAQHAAPHGERLVASEDPPHPKWMAPYLASFREQATRAPLDRIATVSPETLRLVSFGPIKRLRGAFDALGDAPVGRQILPLGSYGLAELTVFSPDSSKGSGLRWLARRLGIPMSQTLAIGDGVNDVSMLRAAGLGIAMGNAAPEIQAEANGVTAPNDEDGAALAIERYVLDGEGAEASEEMRDDLDGALDDETEETA
ncbi:MAG TPA: Cof-type HAD-IIB family hydrolase [Ktedonobacterales bacterium]|nr:Cof-type HAD-IIB family hydrolase [Ktedonobacterales bacterium]